VRARLQEGSAPHINNIPCIRAGGLKERAARLRFIILNQKSTPLAAAEKCLGEKARSKNCHKVKHNKVK